MRLTPLDNVVGSMPDTRVATFRSTCLSHSHASVPDVNACKPNGTMGPAYRSSSLLAIQHNCLREVGNYGLGITVLDAYGGADGREMAMALANTPTTALVWPRPFCDEDDRGQYAERHGAAGLGAPYPLCYYVRVSQS